MGTVGGVMRCWGQYLEVVSSVTVSSIGVSGDKWSWATGLDGINRDDVVIELLNVAMLREPVKVYGCRKTPVVNPSPTLNSPSTF